jgi:hypothetical protein
MYPKSRILFVEDQQPRGGVRAVCWERPNAHIFERRQNHHHQDFQAVSKWRDEAARRGLTKNEIDRMASAFEHDDLKAALAAE